MSWSDAPAGRPRRAWLRGAGAAALAAALAASLAASLAGCGFQLRESTNLAFDSIALQGQAGPLMDLLRRRIAATTATRIVDDPKQAQAVFTLLADNVAQTPTAYNADGTVAQYTLSETAVFRLTGPDGRLYIGPTTISRSSLMSYSTSATLAKASEADMLYAGMRLQLVDRILFQLGNFHPPGAPASAPR